MSTVWRWLSRLLLVLLVAVAVVAAIWAYGRFTSPTPEQEAAVALMQADAPCEGENGFPLMMALPNAPGPFPPAVNCGNAAADTCVAKIESAPEANAAALEPFRPQLEAAAKALHAPVFRDRRDQVPMGADEIPPFQAVVQLDSLRALDFAAGNTAGALSSACEDARGAARWAAEPDTLIQAMVGIAAFRQHASLIADMRRRAPGDALPASCVALAEPPDAAAEGTLCHALRGEWRWQKRAFPSLEAGMREQEDNAWAERLTPLLHDTDWMLANSAQVFAQACGETSAKAAAEDKALPLAAHEPRWVDLVAFPTSVVLGDMALPAYSDYQERQLDFVAQRRVLAAVMQMDAMPAALSNAERFAALPAALRDGPRPLLLADDGMSVAVPLRARRSEQEGGEFRLPLPSRAAAATPSIVLEAPTAP